MYVAVSDAEAIRTHCPTCGAPPGQPCVYVQPPELKHGPTRSKTYLAQVERAGNPTKHAHNARRDEVRVARVRAWHAARRRDLRTVVPVTPDLHDAYRAMREWDLREYQALVLWLRNYGSILC